jgi:cytochrome c-type biogenesis protein
MAAISNIGALTALMAGTISFLSPCVLPLVPGYLSYVAGTAAGGALETRHRRRLAAPWLSFCFVLGFSTIFVSLGASASAIGQLLLSYRYEANLVGGAIVVVFGLLMVGVTPVSWLMRDLRFDTGRLGGGTAISAYVLGIAFGFGWTPCIGPVLGAILTASTLAASAQTGTVLLAFYSAGLGIPFILAAVFTDGLMRRLSQLGRIGFILRIGGGLVMVGMGVVMMTGYMSVLSFWLLDQFPVFTRIG